MNSYRVLGIKPDATEQEVRSAYRRLVRQHHPDLTDSSGSEFRRIRAAYEAILGRIQANQCHRTVRVTVQIRTSPTNNSSRVREVRSERIREVYSHSSAADLQGSMREIWRWLSRR